MDQKQLQQNIALYYSKLPPDVQVVFSSMKWMDALSEISKKYALNGAQIETLGTETTLVMLGIIDLNEYDTTIKNEVKISPILIDKLLLEIDSRILKDLRPKLKNVYESNIKELSDEKDVAQDNTSPDVRLANLSKSIQSAISESNYQAVLYTIAQKYKLSIPQIGDLEEVTTKVISGTLSTENYESELKSKLTLPEDKLKELIKEVNEQVLKNIRNKFRANTENKNVVEDDDEVPIPPYAVTPNLNNTPGNETNIYGDSGIEIIKESVPPVASKIENKEIIPKEEMILNKTGVNLIDDTLIPTKINPPVINNSSVFKKPANKIENIEPKAPSNDIFGSKLRGATSNIASTTDYSLPEVKNEPKTVKPRDPYLEPI